MWTLKNTYFKITKKWLNLKFFIHASVNLNRKYTTGTKFLTKKEKRKEKKLHEKHAKLFVSFSSNEKHTYKSYLKLFPQSKT